MRFHAKAATAAGATALGLLGFAAAPATAAPVENTTVARAASCYVYNTSGTTLNIRSGPGSKYTLIGTLAKGGKLPCGTNKDSVIKGQSYSSCGGGSGWATIRINGRDGWAAAECVAFGV